MSVPDDFLEFSVRAMKNLKEAGRSNIVYDLAKGFGTKRRSSDDTLFPTKHVACGLVEYCAAFLVLKLSEELIILTCACSLSGIMS